MVICKACDKCLPLLRNDGQHPDHYHQNGQDMNKLIIDFYKAFMVDEYNIDAKGIVKNDKGIIKYNYSIDKEQIYDVIAQIIEENIKVGIPEAEICVIAPVWNMLYPFSKRLQERLPNVKRGVSL